MKRFFGWLCLLLAITLPAHGQAAFPSRPVTIVVPFPAGGALDIVARAVAEEMRKSLGQAVIVENRPGAGGTLGSAAVARAAPDGHTLLLGSIATHAIAAGLYRNLPYDPVRDFAPITQLTSAPLMVASSAKVPATNLGELVALAKAQPGKLNFASTGNGTAVHLAGELFKAAAGIDVVHVPYRGGSEATTALMTGEVSFMVVNIQLVLPQVRAGAVRALAVTGASRPQALPAVPTLREAGLPNVEITTWFGLFAPAATPAEVVSRLQRDATAALKTLSDRFAAQGDDVVGSTPEQFAAFVRSEHTKWVKVVRDTGIRLD